MTAKKKRQPRRSGRQESDPRQQMRRQIVDLLSAPDYKPVKHEELRRALDVQARDGDVFQGIVKRLLDEGVIVRLRRKGLALAESADLMVGRITFTRGGSAFVKMSDPKREVFIPPLDTGTALHGDKVMVRLQADTRQRRRGELPVARVIRIIERRRRTIVGTLKRMRRIFYVEPMQSTLQKDVVVPEANGAQVGDRVLIRLEVWDDPSVSPEGEIVDVIGPADDPTLDTLAVMKAFELPESFPEAARQAAEEAEMSGADIQGRMDLRKKFIFTIDPETARDYDDAISLDRTRSGKWRLGVHIADVSHFVKPGDELDDEAQQRSTSVYLPDKVVPMLPEQLSNGLCSLKPDVDRLAFSVLMSLDDDANVTRVDFRESVIRSQLRLTYPQALAGLELSEKDACRELDLPVNAIRTLKQVHRIAQTLREKRRQKGALIMDVPEVKFQIGDDGRIADIVPVHYDISHQLIEECMLLANESVCRFLERRNVPQIHRIHGEPDLENLENLQQMFAHGGIDAGDLTDRRNLARVLEKISDLPQAHAWYTNVLKAMKRAEYSTEALGHYGLAKEYYAHFTSPIRRYPDLITHRMLKAALRGDSLPYGKEALQELAELCSEREQVATEAEREITDLKRIRFFKEQLESGDLHEYEAVIVDVVNMGVFVDLPRVQASGLIHVSELTFDFFDYDPARTRLVGRRTGTTLQVGEYVNVIISRVDESRRRLDFAPVDLPDGQQKKKKTSKRRRRRRQK